MCYNVFSDSSPVYLSDLLTVYTLSTSVYVCVGVCICVCSVCEEYYVYIYIFFRLMCMFAGLTDFVKRSVLTLVDEIPRY